MASLLTYSACGAVIVALLSTAGFGCSQDQPANRGLPPATDWNAPGESTTAPDSSANPHAAGAPANPHAGMDMNDPHAGMDMNDPHAGMDMNDPHAGMDMNDPHAGMDMGGGGVDVAQLGLNPPDPNRQINPEHFLKGTLKPTGETRDAIPTGSVIFLSVKRADPATGKPTGSPLAVKRMVYAAWPMWFHITEEDAMVAGTQFTGDVVITAWSDGDQDAISKQPGDILGEVRATIPQNDIHLLLDTRI